MSSWLSSSKRRALDFEPFQGISRPSKGPETLKIGLAKEQGEAGHGGNEVQGLLAAAYGDYWPDEHAIREVHQAESEEVACRGGDLIASSDLSLQVEESDV